MKVTVDIPKTTLRKMLLLSGAYDNLDENAISEIINTPKMDVTEFVSSENDFSQVPLVLAAAAAPVWCKEKGIEA